MDFMDKITEISKKVGEGVVDTYKVVADKSGKLFEETKSKIAISDKSNDIEGIYLGMGKTVYDMYKKGEDVGKVFAKECKKIDTITDDINEMEKKVLYSKNLRKCENCGAIIAFNSTYCENCGDKQKTIKFKKVEETVKQEKFKEEDVDRVCPTCGTIMDINAKFCQKCGYKFAN